MSRYIDADNILYEDLSEGRGVCWVTFRDLINEMPTADVRENVRGHWELKTCDLYGLADKVTLWAHYCSVCGYHYGTPYNFCPHCGAQMEK